MDRRLQQRGPSSASKEETKITSPWWNVRAESLQGCCNIQKEVHWRSGMERSKERKAQGKGVIKGPR